MRRVCTSLQKQPVRWVAQDGTVEDFTVSVSIGVSEFRSSAEVKGAFDRADKATYAAKSAGKGTVKSARSLSTDS